MYYVYHTDFFAFCECRNVSKWQKMHLFDALVSNFCLKKWPKTDFFSSIIQTRQEMIFAQIYDDCNKKWVPNFFFELQAA